jgi:hypothetical protein
MPLFICFYCYKYYIIPSFFSSCIVASKLALNVGDKNWGFIYPGTPAINLVPFISICDVSSKNSLTRKPFVIKSKLLSSFLVVKPLTGLSRNKYNLR